MRIAVLGPLEVLDDDLAPVQIPGAKERLLLAVLAAHAPAVVSSDALADSLWDGDPPASARKSLQAHVVRLRSSLEPSRPRGSTGRYVLRRGPGYALVIGRADVDALQVGDLAARGHARLASGRADEAAVELAAATRLWRGEPYADWPDALFAETERRRLTEVRAGALAGLLEAQLRLGRHAEVLPEAERLVAEEPLREDWWRLLMVALYRGGRQADALAAARRVRALLAEELGAEPGPALRRTEAAILAQDPDLDLAGVPAPRASGTADPTDAVLAGSCPYKGLAAYQMADAELFHGRRRFVARLLARLVDTRLVLVSGPSGAGKSSVVRAGVLPALAAGALPGSQAWRPVVVSPGRHPVDVIAELTGEAPPAQRVVLVCDQFEELWSPAVDPAERTAFLDALLGLLDDGVVARCIPVVRGDHVGRLAEHAPFAERLAGAVELVPALTEAELREIVRDPAATVGLAVEPELVEAVVADVLGRPGALPLLSTALVGTWERRLGDRLTLSGYLEAGGVGGALIRSAEDAYGALDAAGRDTARRLLVRLADVGDGGALVRRRVPLDEVGLDDVRRRNVVERFVDRRLLAVDGEHLEVVHEALLSAWPRLVRWLEDDAAGRAVRRHLAPAAREWEAGGRPDDELYRGARLVAALDWAAGPDADPTPVEAHFLDASRSRADAELVAARERADQEAAGRRRTRRLAGGLAAVLVVALVATVLAVRSQRNAQRASVVADANRLAALSTTAGALDVSLLLAAQAVRLADTAETQDGLLGQLAEQVRAVRAVQYRGNPQGVILVDGRTLAFGTGAEIVTWEVESSSLPQVAYDIPGDWGAWLVAEPSPTDDVVLSAGENRGVPWIRMTSTDGPSRLLLEGAAVGGRPVAGGFRPDGALGYLLVATPDIDAPDAGARWTLAEVDVPGGTVRDTGIGGTFPGPVDALAADFAVDGSFVLWDSENRSPALLVDIASGLHTPIAVPERPADILGFHALATGAALLWSDGGVTLVDRSGTPVQDLDVHRRAVRDLVVSPDGRWAVTAGDGAAVNVWDIEPSTGRWSQREALTGHQGDVLAVEVDPDGRRLFTVGTDHTIITWDMTADGGFGEPYAGLDGRWIANRPESVEPGRLIVAPTRTGTSINPVRGDGPLPGTETVAATFLDPGTGEVVDEVVLGETLKAVSFGSSVAVSPDRSMVAVTWGLGTTVLDTRTRDVITEIVLPPSGDLEIDGTTLPATAVWCAEWTPDGSTLLLGADEDVDPPDAGYLAAVDTRTWEVDADRIDIGATAQSIDPSPDGRFFAVASESSHEIVLVDAVSLEVERRVALPAEDLVGNLEFSPDGRLLAAGGSLGLLHVFDTSTWEPVGESAAVHDASMLQAGWLADGRTVVTTGMDGTVSLFDVDRGLVRARPLRGSGEPGDGYAHLVPGTDDELVVHSGERTGRRYSLEPSVWLAEACDIVGRDLTRAEWDRYLPDRDFEPTCSDLP